MYAVDNLCETYFGKIIFQCIASGSLVCAATRHPFPMFMDEHTLESPVNSEH
jgi:hypothetical protein